MTPFERVIRKPETKFSDMQCDRLAEEMANNDDTGIMQGVPVGAVFWLQFQPTHDSLNSKEVDGEFFNVYSPAADLQGSYAEEGGWMYIGDKFALHETGGLPRFDLGRSNSREIMADFRGNENSFLRRMHLLSCQIHNKCIDLGMSFKEAKKTTIAITNRITEQQTMLLVEFDDLDRKRWDRLVKVNFHNSLEWNFAAARYAHAMCPALVQGDNPLKTGRLALDIDIRALFDGSELAKTLDPSVSIAMRDMASVPMKKNIIKRTLDRTVSIGLPSYGELASFLGMSRMLEDNEKDMPIWAGLLYEAKRVYDGQKLGPVGANVVYGGNMGHLMEHYDDKQGLFYTMDDNLPETILDVIDWLEE